MKGQKIRICTKYYRANLSLGNIIRNLTLQIFETHPTSKQHKTHIKKLFIPHYLGVYLFYDHIFIYFCVSKKFKIIFKLRREISCLVFQSEAKFIFLANFL
jgi:hypothetical protein